MNESSENFSQPNNAGTEMETPHSNGKEKSQSSLFEILKFLILAILIVAPIRFFIAEPYIVNGASMSPTFETADYLIVDKITYRLEKPQRGDVVVFRFPEDKSKFFIKRIIGLPGETVKISNGNITILSNEYPEGFLVEEDYIKNHSFENLEQELGDGQYFVMGDNRPASSDSRSWGVLPENLITGRAFIRLLPLSKIEVYPGEVNF